MNSAVNVSGEISLSDGSIRYCGASESSWELPLSDLAVIGEYTNQSGPVIDDWFLVFVSRISEQYLLAPVYAAGVDSLRASLGTMLNTSLATSLANSADLKSIVLWPPQLAGSDLMQFPPVVPSGVVSRVTHLFVRRVNVALAPSVLSYVRGEGT